VVGAAARGHEAVRILHAGRRGSKHGPGDRLILGDQLAQAIVDLLHLADNRREKNGPGTFSLPWHLSPSFVSCVELSARLREATVARLFLQLILGEQIGREIQRKPRITAPMIALGIAVPFHSMPPRTTTASSHKHFLPLGSHHVAIILRLR
jgi:hypothetical protein